MARKLFWAIWKRWVATDIHLDQYSLLRKQWSPLRWVPGGAFVESASWWAACLAREVTRLSLWKSVTNLWLEGLDNFNQSGYFRWLFAEGIFVLFCNLVNLLLLDRRCFGRSCGGCSILLFTLWTNCGEDEFSSMRYYLAALFRWGSSWNYLWYPVEMTPQSNNDTTGSRLIDSMVFPHIWLAQENITDIQWGNIT